MPDRVLSKFKLNCFKFHEGQLEVSSLVTSCSVAAGYHRLGGTCCLDFVKLYRRENQKSSQMSIYS